MCDSIELIDESIKETVLTSPDYVDWEFTNAVNDFKVRKIFQQMRIEHHASGYETLSDTKLNFVKFVNEGEHIIVNNVKGYLQVIFFLKQTRLVYFLTNLNFKRKTLYLTQVLISMNLVR